MSKSLTIREVVKKELDKERDLVERIEGLPHLHGHKLYPWQRQVLESKNKNVFVTAANQIGKDLAYGTLVPTPTGLVPIEQLAIGATVFGQDGWPTKVIAIPFDGEADGLKLTFNDGSVVVCGPNHDWICKSGKIRFKKTWTSGDKKTTTPNDYFDKWQVRSAYDIKTIGGYSPEPRRDGTAFSFPVTAPVVIRPVHLFDPYAIGYLIGNGALTMSPIKVSINALDTDVSDYFKNRYGGVVSGKPIDLKLGQFINGRVKLLGLNVRSPEKDIPEEYLVGGIEQRKELLAGLMDSDGTASQKGDASYSTTSKKLADSFRRLVTSLGGIAQTKKRKAGYRKDGKYIRCLDCYVINVWVEFNPFRCKRKADRWRPRDRDRHERVLWRIESAGRVRSRCITVDNNDGSFLCTENHLVTHNSSIFIKKNIHWCTEKSLWPDLWRTKPRAFLYLYPSYDVASREFSTKWLPEFLPRGKFKDDSTYGWKPHFDKKDIKQIEFASGCSIYFLAYAQAAPVLQAITAHMVTADEELPSELYPELRFRLMATEGYFGTAFTCTLNQEFWRAVMEDRGQGELFPDALKLQISMFDCLKYEDGSDSNWTRERIEEAISFCPTAAEVQRRVYGKFVVTEGRRYPSFSRTKNVRPPLKEIPSEWLHFCGIDSGSGTERGHPSAITFVAVRPDFKMGRVYKHWNGKGQLTTASDVFQKFIEMRGTNRCVLQSYDYSARDLGVIAQRAGESFAQAKKDRELGDNILNSLFKNEMLVIDDIDENYQLIHELERCNDKDRKTTALDDSVDATRYCCTPIPWDWQFLNPESPQTEATEPITTDEKRFAASRHVTRDWQNAPELDMNTLPSEEIAFWQTVLDS